MKKKQISSKCWEYFHCTKKECPAYQSEKAKCWLISGTYCYNAIRGTWIEKMEVCLNCRMYKSNFDSEDWESTISLISEQFSNYKKRTKADSRILKESKKKLQEFKTTSSYLLKELDKKSREIKEEKNKLDNKVKERTKELENLHSKMIRTSKMATVGSFSAGIAHEINNPLGAVLYYTRKVLVDSEIKKQNRDNLELILKGLIRIETIVKQILSYTRYHKSDLLSSEINHILKDAITFIPYKHKKKKITLKLASEGTLPAIILNPTQIQQVFINIITNAIDSIGSKGELVIETIYKNGMIVITFRDTGKGMNKEVQEKVFDPFFTTKDVGKGTGLGLFICYNILQLYNGTIDIKSIEGEGTEVTISLPVPNENNEKI